MTRVKDIRQELKQRWRDNQITPDPQGRTEEEYQIIEILGTSFHADEPSVFLEPNSKYIEREIRWYQTMSSNIYDIYHEMQNPPKAWRETANKHGEINSNYGRLIFSDLYYNQYDQVVDELLLNPNSRRATMVYTRPSIWYEYCENGKNDFICTNAVTYYIRDNALHCVVQMRSNDVVYGYRNDFAWQSWVLSSLAKELRLEVGTIYWQVQNFHIYGRHFYLLDNDE